MWQGGCRDGGMEACKEAGKRAGEAWMKEDREARRGR